jgi:hypothetical protein
VVVVEVVPQAQAELVVVEQVLFLQDHLMQLQEQ